MITDKDHLLGSKDERNETLWLRGLSALINKHKAKAKSLVGDARITSTNARAANDIGCLEELAFGRVFEALVALFVGRCELALVIAQGHELLQHGLVGRVEMAHLIVQRQVLHGAVHCLARFGTQTHHLEPSGVNLLRQLVHGHVGWRTHENLVARMQARQIVDNGSARHCLACSRRALNERQRTLKHLFHGQHLRRVELWQAFGVQLGRQFDIKGGHLHLVPEQLVVHKARHTLVVHGKRAQRRLHAVKRRGLPYKVHTKIERQIDGAAGVANFDGNLLM